MKKLLLFLLTILLPLVTNAHDLEVQNADGVTIYYNYINDGTELEVTFRGNYHYSYKNEYTGNVAIPGEVTYMNRTRQVTSIGQYAFRDCSNLTSITIPNSVTTIGHGTFYDCYKLTSITIPNSVTGIASYAFRGCSGLISMIIPDGVTSIGDNAFRFCSRLISITIPNSVTSIGYNAFEGCSSLAKVIISDIAAWCEISFENNPLTYAHHLYSDENTEITHLVIPNSVTSIGHNTFSGCSGLTSITIPNSVTSIGSYAFQNCSGLTSITIPNSVTSIGRFAFYGCIGLTSVAIPDGVMNIDDSAFMDCAGLTFVTIANSVTSIGNYAFQNCSGLTSITIPNSVISIGNDAFRGCSGLTSVTIGNSVMSIGSDAFYYCPALTKVIVSDIAAWCEISFGGNYANPLQYAHHLYSDENTEITHLVIPNNVTRISSYAFYYCYNLTSVIISNSVTSIENETFYNCSGLTSITIGNSVTSIGSSAFSGCTGLTSVTIPNSVTTISREAFGACTALTSVTIGDSVTSIDDYAFLGCTGLTSITIPNSVTSIGSGAFGEVDILTVISLIENPFIIPNNTFTQNTLKNATLYVPMGSIDKYKSTKGWKDFMFIEEGIPVLPVTYHLTYYIDGTEYKTYEIEEGAEITPEPDPTKEGYTFSGWSEIPEIMPAHDVTITGTFAINSYKLTYILDGELYKSFDIEYGATITPEAEPTKEGYTFSGWSEIPETMPAHDVTVIGTFSINSYKLTYTVDGVEYKSYDIEYGATITPEAEPIKEGYTFSGWSEIPATMPAHDVTVTGTFSINKYKLTYVVDGEVYKTYDIEYGATITPETEPTKEGYTFSGWSEIPETMPAHDVTVTGTFSINKYKLTYTVDGEVYKTYEMEYGATITPEAEPAKEGYTFSGWSTIPETMPAHDVTITGTFIINKYKLTYIVDGEVYKSYDIEYGATITPEAEPSKEGYTFSGWSTIPTTMPAYDVTITGSFTKGAYKLTYMLDGVVYKTISYDYGDAITPEPAPVREGYTFSGWSEIPETMPAHDVTVIGTFSINSYKLTYVVDDVEYKSYDIEYGATITPEVEPTKEGYTFSGWSEIPATMPAHDVTVTGTFTLDTGIEQIMSNANGDIMIFTIDGKRVVNLKKGMNVIRMKDGTTRKVVVK